MYCFNLCGKYDPPSKVACPVIYLSTVKMPKKTRKEKKKKNIVLPKDLPSFPILYFSRVNAQEFSYMHR